MLIDFQDVRIENLKFRTDLPYRVIDGCSIRQ